MVLRSRLRRLLLGLFVLALIAVAYFISQVHNRGWVKEKLPAAKKVVFWEEGERRVKFVPANSRNVSEDPDNDDGLSYQDESEVGGDTPPAEGKHYQLFKEFSAGLRRLDGVENMTKLSQKDLTRRLNRRRKIRVPTPPKKLPFPNQSDNDFGIGGSRERAKVTPVMNNKKARKTSSGVFRGVKDAKANDLEEVDASDLEVKVTNDNNREQIKDTKSNDLKKVKDTKSNDLKEVKDTKSKDFREVKDTKYNDLEEVKVANGNDIDDAKDTDYDDLEEVKDIDEDPNYINDNSLEESEPNQNNDLPRVEVGTNTKSAGDVKPRYSSRPISKKRLEKIHQTLLENSYHESTHLGKEQRQVLTSTTLAPDLTSKVTEVNPYMTKIKVHKGVSPKTRHWRNGAAGRPTGLERRVESPRKSTREPAVVRRIPENEVTANNGVRREGEASPVERSRNAEAEKWMEPSKPATTAMAAIGDHKVTVSVVQRRNGQGRTDSARRRNDRRERPEVVRLRAKTVTEVNPYMQRIKIKPTAPQRQRERVYPRKPERLRQSVQRRLRFRPTPPTPERAHDQTRNQGMRSHDMTSDSRLEGRRRDPPRGDGRRPPTPAPTARPRLCNRCFEPRFTYLINPQSVCKHAEDSILALVMVFSEHSHQQKRTDIRETWGSVTSKNVGVVRLVFVLGDIGDEVQKAQTRQESAVYGDILMGDFHDDFRNLTLKTVMSLRWATQNCARAKYLMKTDDDMWVNVPLFLSIEKHYQLERAIGGTCWTESWEPHREGGKYYVSELEYPEDHFPPLCVGTAYVMTLQTASDICRVQPNIPFFHLEDVYIALCREHLGYSVVPIPGFWNKKEQFSVCYYRTKVVTSHWVTESELREAWTKECFLQPNDPISEYLSRHPAIPWSHPRHNV